MQKFFFKQEWNVFQNQKRYKGVCFKIKYNQKILFKEKKSS